MDIHSPFICCKLCEQRIPLRIDRYPTWHGRPDGSLCFASWPQHLLSYGFLARAYNQ